MPVIEKPLNMARKFISACVLIGDKVVDATAGNGRDTLFLARLVGEEGKVFSFDIQQDAIMQTRRLLEAENMLGRVNLIQCGHEHMQKYVQSPISAVMFNLGYLPGGDHQIITCPQTTIMALKTSLQMLKRGGIVTIVIYTGHRGGPEEKTALAAFCKKLNQKNFTVLCYTITNQVNEPPSLLVIEKLI